MIKYDVISTSRGPRGFLRCGAIQQILGKYWQKFSKVSSTMIVISCRKGTSAMVFEKFYLRDLLPCLPVD